MAQEHISRAGILLAAVLGLASLWVLAEGTALHVITPPVVNAPATTANAESSRTATTNAQNSQGSAASRRLNSLTYASFLVEDDVGGAQQLSQTSTVLPLLGLIGLGSLVAGLFARR